MYLSTLDVKYNFRRFFHKIGIKHNLNMSNLQALLSLGKSMVILTNKAIK